MGKRVFMRSVALPNEAKERMFKARRDHLEVGRDPYECIPELEGLIKRKFKESKEYQINAPYLNSLAYLGLFDQKEVQRYSFLYQSRSVNCDLPAVSSDITVRLQRDNGRNAGSLQFFGIPDFLMEDEDWVVWRTEERNAPPDTPMHMVLGDRVIKVHQVLGMGSVRMILSLSEIPEVEAQINEVAELRKLSTAEHNVWCARARHFNTTKQLLDWDGSAFQYIPGYIKRRMER